MADVLGYSADTLEFGPLMLFQLDTGQGANALEFEATEIPSSPQREVSSVINKVNTLAASLLSCYMHLTVFIFDTHKCCLQISGCMELLDYFANYHMSLVFFRV